MFRKALPRPIAGSFALAVIVVVVLVMSGVSTVLADSPAAPTPTAAPAATPCTAGGAAPATPCATGSTNPLSAVGNAITGVPGAVAGSIAGDATATFTQWVAGGAAYVLDQTGTWLQDATPPTLNSTWWDQHYASMRQVAFLLMFPFLMAAVIGAIARRDPLMMVQAFMIRTPLAFILTAVAVLLTTTVIAASDQMTAMVAGPGTSGDTFTFMHNLSNTFTGAATHGNPLPLFLVAIAAVLTVLAGLVMFLELLLRSGVIYIALLFMPLALAASVWPGAQRWAKRLAETLVAAILSKFVIITVVSLAVGALAATTSPAAAGGGGGRGGSDGIGTLLTGVIVLGLAAFAPYKLFRILPNMEAAAIGHMEGMRQRGMSGARAAVSAPRDALDRLSRQRATESGALSGKTARGLGRGAGATAALVTGVGIAGVAGGRAAKAYATNTPGGGADAGGGASSSGTGSGPSAPVQGAAAGSPPPTHTPPSAAARPAAAAAPASPSPAGAPPGSSHG